MGQEESQQCYFLHHRDINTVGSHFCDCQISQQLEQQLEESGQGDFILLFWSLLISPCYLLTMILSSAPSFRQMGMQAALPVAVYVRKDLVVSCKPTQGSKVKAYMATKSGCGGILI